MYPISNGCEAGFVITSEDLTFQELDDPLSEVDQVMVYVLIGLKVLGVLALTSCKNISNVVNTDFKISLADLKNLFPKSKQVKP